MKVDEFVAALKSGFPGGWRETAVDRYLFGDGSAELRGVAFTMMASVDVVRRAAAKGVNLLVSHEPLFYNHHGQITADFDDDVVRTKAAILAAAGMTVFHLHDNVHHKGDDMIHRGMASHLGWKTLPGGAFDTGSTRLHDLVADLRLKLGSTTLRFIGDPARAYGVAVPAWGFVMFEQGRALLGAHESAMLVVGETHEWELVEYVQDAAALGKNKALVVLGHSSSEEAGFRHAASEIMRSHPDIRFDYIEYGEAFR